MGRLDEAIANYNKAISIDPDFAEAYNNLGIALKGLGRLDEAVESYNRAISINPDFAEAHCNLGNALRDLSQLTEAVDSYDKAVSIKPAFVEAHNNLGIALKGLGRLDEAVESYLKAISINPNHTEAHNSLGNALNELGRFDEAVASYKIAISIIPDYAEAHCNLGTVFNELGQLNDAITSYKIAISSNPDHAKAHYYLSCALKHHDYDDTIRAMETFYARDDISSEQRMHLAFGLGKAFEDLIEHNRSFAYILEGNRLKRASYQYRIKEDIELYDKIKDVFSPVFFSNHPHAGNSDETPVFILGMPRSGSTLVEQILASHSLVFGAGELKDLSSLANTIRSKRRGNKFPECVSDLNEEELFALGSKYLDRLRKHSDINRFITDNMPHNFQLIGLIKVILPKARVIHCMRDPMDNCYSIFKKNFAEEHKYAYEMMELGQYYNLYLDLMDHWRKSIPDFIYDIRYEELVFNQEEQTKKLLNYCKLPWEESCLSFHKTKRRVATASVNQVRRPIYSDSIRLWKKYERQLETLQKALGE